MWCWLTLVTSCQRLYCFLYSIGWFMGWKHSKQACTCWLVKTFSHGCCLHVLIMLAYIFWSWLLFTSSDHAYMFWSWLLFTCFPFIWPMMTNMFAIIWQVAQNWWTLTCEGLETSPYAPSWMFKWYNQTSLRTIFSDLALLLSNLWWTSSGTSIPVMPPIQTCETSMPMFFQHWAGCLPCFHGWHEPFATVIYKPEDDSLYVFVNARVHFKLWTMMIWCMIIASHVCHQNFELINGPSFCRMDLPGPTTSVGTRTDYSVGPWDYPACATRHLKAWSTRTTQE
jgi:hypothetical protein